MHFYHIVVQAHNNSRGNWKELIFSLSLTPEPKMPPTKITCRRESYLYGWVIFIHKVVLDELYGECTLAHTSSTHHHQLIFRHLCRCCSPHTPLLERRKVQVSTLTTNIHITRFGENNIHTQSFDKLLSATGLPRCGPRPEVQTKHTIITITAQWWETLVVCVCVCVCSGGWGWDPQRGMWKMCWRYSMFQSSPAQCEQQRVCTRGRAREAAGEKKKGHDTGRLTLITQASHYWYLPLNPMWQTPEPKFSIVIIQLWQKHNDQKY